MENLGSLAVGRMGITMAAVCLLLTAAAAAGVPAGQGRIDLYSPAGSFEVHDVRVSPGAKQFDVGWRGEGMQATGATAQACLRDRWQEIWIEVVPERDGELQLGFQGEYYRQLADDDVRPVWVDAIRVQGADLVNGDLEELAADGRPRGWTFAGSPAPTPISRDGRIAISGKVCASVWWGAQLRQTIAVRAGRPVRVTAWFRRLGPAVVPPAVVQRRPEFAELLELERRTIVVEFATPEAARQADLRPLPLPGGAEWAITSRWDDNSRAHRQTRAVLRQHGHRGTFFLNDPAGGFHRGRYHSDSVTDPVGELGRLLASGGTSIGSHSLTHPMLSYVNRHRMFEELLGCRIALEASFDALVNAHAFSFCNLTSRIEGTAVERDIATLLARAGFLQVANHRFAEQEAWPWGIAGLLPADGAPIDDQFASFLADDELFHENPAITFSMHSWYETPAEWAAFGADLERYGGQPAWWYCNHNEYGAYRAQYRAAREGRVEVDGRTLVFTFDRPALIDLNDPIPLSFAIAGVDPDLVRAIESPGGRIERLGASGSGPAGKGPGPLSRVYPIDGAVAATATVRFQLHHAAGARLPARIDHLATDSGRLIESPEFPGLRGVLESNGTELKFQLQNGGSEPMRVRRVAYRLPLYYAGGVVRRSAFELGGGDEYSDVVPLEAAGDEGGSRAGILYFAAQVDFVVGDLPGRLYVTTRRHHRHDDASYPGRGFSILGPIPRRQIDLSTWSPAMLPVTLRGGRSWLPGGGRRLDFADVDEGLAELLSAEVIPVRGRWDDHDLQPSVYLLRSTVQAPGASAVRFRCDSTTVTSIWLDGHLVDGVTTLNAGDNDLLLVYEPPHERSFAPEHAGPMLRIVDARTGDRHRAIRYRR